MKNKFNVLLSYFNDLNFKYKTYFLIFIISGGMLCIIILSQISIFTIKQDFDILFDQRTRSLIQLENIKDAYQVNIQNTLIDFEKKQINQQRTNEILNLAQEMINKNWISYKNQTKFENREFLSTFIKLFIIKEENYYENEALKNALMQNINNKMCLRWKHSYSQPELIRTASRKVFVHSAGEVSYKMVFDRLGKKVLEIEISLRNF